MKKLISLVLTALILFSLVTVGVAAIDYTYPEYGTIYDKTECDCESHFSSEDEYCNCCLYCNNFQNGYRTSCLQFYVDTNRYTLCCGDCTGIWPCDCGCDCCREHDEYFDDTNNGSSDEDLNNDDSEQGEGGFTDVFASILDKIAEFFNKIIEMIKNMFKL